MVERKREGDRKREIVRGQERQEEREICKVNNCGAATERKGVCASISALFLRFLFLS